MSKFDCDIHQEDKDEIYDCIACVYDRIEANERNRILKLIDGRICFDHRTDNNCDHGQCWALHDLKALIQGVDLHEE